MSVIDKLSILGVRSFDNTRSETIQFYAPLTLIVGQNGSGKTTIIECLKYATIGEQPGGKTGGQLFIHDPKLCGEKEVLAQVKISFKSTEGTRMVCTRNMQLTVKKASRTFKTLDGTLMMLRNGERITMSSRVAEMDTMMPQYLGVSKAVLDSVIFCHQEDSLWPLQEASKLKVQFDALFEAQKYTKAIESIVKLARQKKEDLKLLAKDEDHAREKKNKSEQKQAQMAKLSDEIDALRASSKEVLDDLREAQNKSEAAYMQTNEANMTVSKLQGKRIVRDTKQESVHSLREHVREMSESDQELQDMLDRYDERVKSLESQAEDKRKVYHEIREKIQTTRSAVSAKERECGSYEAQKETHERHKQNRETLVKQTARSHGIRGYDMDLKDHQIREFMDRISKMARDQSVAFQRARSETQDKLKEAQNALNQVSERRTALGQRKEGARQTISTYERKVDGFRKELDKVTVDEGALATLQSQQTEVNSRLDKAKSARTTANFDKEIKNLEGQISKHDQSKEQLDAELNEATRHASDSAQLDFVRKELKVRQEGLETMKSAHSEKLSALLGSGWSASRVESDFEHVLQQKTADVAEAELERNGATTDNAQLNFKLQTCQSDLEAKRKEIRAAVSAIKKAVDCAPEQYPSALEDCQRESDEYKANKEQHAKVLEFFEGSIRKAEKENGCMMCKREFKNDSELQKMLDYARAMCQKFTLGPEDEKEIDDADEALKKAQSASTDYDSWERLKNKEIPALERQEQSLSKQREELTTKLEGLDILVSERQAAKKDIQALAKTVQMMAKYYSDITSYDSQIRDLVAKQESAGLSRGLDIIQEEIKNINEKIRGLRSQLSKATSERDRADKQINNLELESRDVKSKLSTANYQLEQKQSLESQIEEYKTLISEQRETIKSVDQELQGLHPQQSQAQIKYDEIARQGAETDREMQADHNKLNSSLNKLQNADQDIQAYIDRGGDELLTNAKAKADELREDVVRLEHEQNVVVRDVKDLETKLRNHSDTKRGIEDNQKFRRDLRALKAVTEEIEQLEQLNAEEDKARYEAEANYWNMQRTQKASEHASIVGQLKTKDQLLADLIKEFDQEFKSAPREYKEAHIKSETTKACVEDLGRYSSALDKAIMKYHSLKMEEINGIIEELWRKTYQGTDVDTIMIKSENEIVKANKNYNYRVVMVKQDAEMDMRGRCSAGQKVLACIIIRLALAECFGTNCGLIALDEPTTNLDQENISALARSLGEIIRVRKAQKNFQLIVITHDEEFLRAMGCSEYADHYWRVSRNARQKSVIEKQSIAEVM